MALVYWTSDGGGAEGGDAARVMNQWIRSKGNPSLIVYGGDVYRSGSEDNFAKFFDQFGRDVSLVCETPGNHDWKTTKTVGGSKVPIGYEEFWKAHASKQPIDTQKAAGARYEHFIDLNGWRLIFLDTGLTDDGHPWPFGDPARQTWLTNAVTSASGRSKIVFAHHSRLSNGLHGDNVGVHTIWKSLFDPATAAPRAAFTLGGHDHNVSLFGPKSRDNVTGPNVPTAQGIRLLVNGAGGDSLYAKGDGTPPDEFDHTRFCVTRINLIDDRSADVDILSFGVNPKPTTEPDALANFAIKFRF
jgi:hypothetical protein